MSRHGLLHDAEIKAAIFLQVGGRRQSCEKHMEAIRLHQTIQGSDVDFKLSQSYGAANHLCREESGFARLAVRECQELVPFRMHLCGPPLSCIQYYPHCCSLYPYSPLAYIYVHGSESCRSPSGIELMEFLTLQMPAQNSARKDSMLPYRR